MGESSPVNRHCPPCWSIVGIGDRIMPSQSVDSVGTAQAGKVLCRTEKANSNGDPKKYNHTLVGNNQLVHDFQGCVACQNLHVTADSINQMRAASAHAIACVWGPALVGI